MRRTDDKLRNVKRQTMTQQERSVAKERKRRNGEAPTAEFRREWSQEFRDVMGTKATSWGPRDRANAKRIVDEFGLYESVDMMRHYLQTWKKRGADGVPNVGHMWAMRQRLLLEMSGECEVESRDRSLDIRLGEWENTGDVPKRGWG